MRWEASESSLGATALLDAVGRPLGGPCAPVGSRGKKGVPWGTQGTLGMPGGTRGTPGYPGVPEWFGNRAFEIGSDPVIL